MIIRDLYQKYQIMPQLSLHMRRVAGVGKLILDGWQGEIDKDLVMRAMLLHDMGNIVKFDLHNPLMPIENLESWKKIQKEWWEKYGRDAHEVTNVVVRELKRNDVLEVLAQEHAGYVLGDTRRILKEPWPAKILAYCDVRVIPSGVVPLKVRIADLQQRYGRELAWYDFLYNLEKEVERLTKVDLDTITDEAIEPMLDDLLTYKIE